MINKLIVSLVASVITTVSFAQSPKVSDNWLNQRPENGVYGLGLNDIYKHITENKLKVKKTPIVAIIGGGVDVEHEALKKFIWTNTNEKADGKDNDGNGYIDDINGWNFIGGKDSAIMERTMREGDREYFRLKDKYGHLFRDKETKEFFYYKPDQIKRILFEGQIDTVEWNYYSSQVKPESKISRVHGGYNFAFMLKEFAHKFNDELKLKIPNMVDCTMEEFAKTCWDRTGPQDEWQNLAMYSMGMQASISKIDSWNIIFAQYSTNKHIEVAYKKYLDILNKLGDDKRKEIVGDRVTDINDKVYGNNIVFTANSDGGTAMAGVITGKRGVEGCNTPITENTLIMPLVVTCKEGEPYLKDIALSIRYAVDNGATVIVLPQQNTFYTAEGKKWVTDALRYAENKNVMVIVPTWELSYNMDIKEFFPNRKMAEGESLSNLLVISPSTKDGKPFILSNYGAKSVDLYAPAEKILTTYIGDTYREAKGLVMGTGTTAGVVALLQTYYPELTVAQIRETLIQSCTSRKGVEVEKGIVINGKKAQDLFLFEQLCISGGVLNAYNAFIEAGKIVSKK